MAKDKDRAQNPAAAQRKLEKQKALKKGKAQVAAQRNERLAHRNPSRLESQVADLQALRDSQGGQLSARDQKQLVELERDVARVKKARESLGDKAPTFNSNRGGYEGGGRGRDGSTNGPRGRGRGGYVGLGKRSRDDAEEAEVEEQESEETDEEVRKIPWPRDTPPPIPHRRNQRLQGHGSNANTEPLAPGRERFFRAEEPETIPKPDTSLPAKPATAPIRTTYESAPQVKNLQKEATARFVPAAVKRKIDATKGLGKRLLSEEELTKLEEEGYGFTAAKLDPTINDEARMSGNDSSTVDEASRISQVDSQAALMAERLKEEEQRFAQEIEDENME